LVILFFSLIRPSLDLGHEILSPDFEVEGVEECMVSADEGVHFSEFRGSELRTIAEETFVSFALLTQPIGALVNLHSKKNLKRYSFQGSRPPLTVLFGVFRI
jgi:hypothetical protein